MDIEAMILEHTVRKSERKPVNRVANRQRLLELSAALSAKHEFQVGDFVEYKEGLKNKSGPANGDYIVMAVLDTPVFDEKANAGSPYFREPLDLIVAEVDEDKEVLTEWHMDSRRFQLSPQLPTATN